MQANQAKTLGEQIAKLVRAGQIEPAVDLLAPVLAERTPFRMLDLIGEAVGAGPVAAVNPFLERLAAGQTIGGWVVIGTALRQQWSSDPDGAFTRCRNYIISGDVWHATDCLAERVSGPALVTDFEAALALLAAWSEDPNRWVRRAVGVSVHFWAKRSRGSLQQSPQAEAVLAFLEPLFEERESDAIKGIGWGLKTLGRYYPELLADWLHRQLVQQQRQPRALMLRKALTYLSAEQRARATGAGS